MERETQHEVELTQGFWLADTTVTQALWQLVMGENPSNFKDNPENPVENVSWKDTQTFIKKLKQLYSELEFQLPSEAQWEYACRAGATTPFSFGDNISSNEVNFDGSRPYANGRKSEDRNRTVAVKSLPENSWGLYEMHGNVWEWCNDRYGEYNGDATDPTGPEAGDERVLRGGSWILIGRHCRSAARYMNTPDFRNNRIGFRLALGHELRPDQQEQAYRQAEPARRGAAPARADVKPVKVIQKVKKWFEKS